MGLSVMLLEGTEDERTVLAARLRTIVGSGTCDRARALLEGGQVLEVHRQPDGDLAERLLTPDEIAPILAERAELFEDYGYHSEHFSWDELGELGCENIQDLAVEMDEAHERDRVEIEWPHSSGAPSTLRMISLHASQWNWLDRGDKPDHCWRLHRLARRHHLVVISG